VSRNLHFSWRMVAAAFFLMLTSIAAIPARAAQDIVEFGSDIDVPPADTIHDAVCFFCSVNVKGTVNGDIVVFFGSVRIDGHANHDVVNFFGSVTAGNDTSIGHDLVNFFGGVRLGENVTVGQDTVVMFGNLRKADTASFGGSRVVEPGWLFWGPFVVLILGIYYVVHEFRGYRHRRVLGY
jgi:hypothetical protein